MSGVAVEHLKAQLQMQRAKLGEVAADTRDTIEAGRQAQEQLDAQKEHVRALEQAIDVLENHEREREMPA